MRVKVLFFAGLRDLVGNRELQYDLEEGATVADLCARIAGDFPALEKLHWTPRFAVEEEYAPPDRPLSDGVTVAAIPPVSGG